MPDDSDYEPGEDDYSSWLAPLSPLDRAMERGNASVVTTLLKGFTGPWEALSTRMAKAKRRSTDASGSAAAAAAMYVGMFAGSMAAATAVISELQTAPTAGELAAPLSIALSRGAAGVAQALINAGADVEAAAPRKVGCTAGPHGAALPLSPRDGTLAPNRSAPPHVPRPRPTA